MADNAQPVAIEAEWSVVGAMLTDPDALAQMAAALTEDLFSDQRLKVMFRAITRVFSSGGVVDPVTVTESLKGAKGEWDASGGAATIQKLLVSCPDEANVGDHAELVREYAARREVIRIGAGMVQAFKGGGSYNAEQIVDLALNRLTSVVVRTGIYRGPTTAEDFIMAERARMEADGSTGIALPYRKFKDQVGHLVPGDAVAIPGYSNSGKTMLAANLCRFWTFQSYYQDWYPTESMDRYLSRIAACHARVNQFYPEREAWHLAGPEEKEAYDFALSDLLSMKHVWNLVPRANVTPEEIIAESMRARRKRPDGSTVIVVVDHMHRLNYGGINPAFAVADATKRLRDWAKLSTQKGDPIILVLLFQPRKPDIDVNEYRPVTKYNISGSGLVGAELDIIFSPYRRWVKTEPGAANNPLLRTPWGTPRALLRNGRPVACKPESEEAKVEDENVAVKFVKRRTGGEGPTVLLPLDAPSGRIEMVEDADALERTA